MMLLIDSWMPWLGDLLALGGPILGLILLMAFLMWSLLFERIFYLYAIFPKRLRDTVTMWKHHQDKSSWFAQQYRDYLGHCLGAELNRNFALIGTIIKVCPLLGLLGTVVGMLEVFDALAATGSNNPRSMAAGVSKATVSTLAGMVVAIFGLLTSKFAERRAIAERDSLPGRFISAI
ncbi:MAG: MotA/TolQ/ExbB proton channel family protein [Gammaproteobacteria bacterium]|nr:MotA/TolQ/ExbB proton channel family protein [Gammaproteobacteria bacterium]NND39629.1 MotA/TolQ/ExbB proton channel family protein [Pseudomonadales bacterium]NNM11869.1 MotA/TolQ/ExbB proton channel family protein [Pseudomonadales bacterium]RZV50000.1 MAG: MotA/TolQ/ExbB proton channel family protein [Pseudomonadales bacterium]